MRLETVLHANATFSGIAGVVALAGAGPVAGWIDAPVAVTAAVGAFLVVWAAGLFALTRRPTRRHEALAVIIGDLTWTGGALGLALAGAGLSGPGRVVLVISAIGTADFAWFQWRALPPADRRAALA